MSAVARDQVGLCSSGDESHSLMCEPVSACRALRRRDSRAAPGGSDLACARRRFASSARRTSRDRVCLKRRRSMTQPPCLRVLTAGFSTSDPNMPSPGFLFPCEQFTADHRGGPSAEEPLASSSVDLLLPVESPKPQPGVNLPRLAASAVPLAGAAFMTLRPALVLRSRPTGARRCRSIGC